MLLSAPTFFDLTKLNLNSLSKDARPKPSGLVVDGDSVHIALNHLRPDSSPGGPGYLATLSEQSGELVGLKASKYTNTGDLRLVSAERKLLASLSTGSFDFKAGAYRGDGGLDIYENGQLKSSTALPGAPAEMAHDPAGEQIYINDASQTQVFVIDVSNGKLARTISFANQSCPEAKTSSTFKYLSAIAADADYLYVTEFSSACLFILNRRTDEVLATIETGMGPEVIYGL